MLVGVTCEEMLAAKSFGDLIESRPVGSTNTLASMSVWRELRVATFYFEPNYARVFFGTKH